MSIAFSNHPARGRISSNRISVAVFTLALAISLFSFSGDAAGNSTASGSSIVSPTIANSVYASTVQDSSPVGKYFDHVVVVLMENQGIADVCAGSPPPCSGSNGDPYLAGLANGYSLSTQYVSLSHHSYPNYIAMLGGSTFGCNNDACAPAASPNLVDRLESAGLNWKAYMENQNGSTGCDTVAHAPYTPQHNPFVAFSDILNSSARCSQIVLANPHGCPVTDCALTNDLNSTSAPNFIWLTPNYCDDMHGFTYPNGTELCPTSIPHGDAYLSSLVPNILNSLTFKTERSALFLVFDEGNSYCPLNATSEDCVFALWTGPEAKNNFTSANFYNSYSFTRTIEANWNLTSLTSNDASATPMSEFFLNNPALPSPSETISFSYSPSSPAAGESVAFNASVSGGTTPYVYSWSFGDNVTGSGSSPIHAYKSVGPYDVLLTVSDASSELARTERTIKIVSQQTPPLTIAFTINPSSPVEGQPVTFTASASGGVPPYSFSWNFGDGNKTDGNPSAHIYSNAGQFDVIVLATDANGTIGSNTSAITVSAPLRAGFTFTPSSPSTGQTVTFIGSANGGSSPYKYFWNFGDGSNGTGSSPAHAYTSAGSYSVVLAVTDSGSSQPSATSQETITVTSASLSTIFNYSPESPELGQQVRFTAKAYGGSAPYSYSWAFGDGTGSSTNPAIHTYSSSGSFTVTVTATDASGAKASFSQTINISQTPSISFSYSPTEPEAKSPITFTATTNGTTGPFIFSWTFGDGGTSQSNPVTYTYANPGTYTITAAATDSNGVQVTSIKTINVVSALGVSFAESPSSPEANLAETFTATTSGGAGPFNVSWNFGDGGSAAGTKTVHTYLYSGKFTATVTVIDADGAEATFSQTFEVAPALTASFVSTPSSPDAGQTTSFTSSLSGGVSPYVYSWSFGDGRADTRRSPSHRYEAGGSFVVVLIVTDADGVASRSSQTIEVNPPLSGSFTYNPSQPLPLLPITFTARATGGSQSYTYTWVFGDGSTGSGSTVSHAYLLPGVYTVALTITDSNGQTFTTSQTITVLSGLL